MWSNKDTVRCLCYTKYKKKTGTSKKTPENTNNYIITNHILNKLLKTTCFRTVGLLILKNSIDLIFLMNLFDINKKVVKKNTNKRIGKIILTR